MFPGRAVDIEACARAFWRPQPGPMPPPHRMQFSSTAKEGQQKDKLEVQQVFRNPLYISQQATLTQCVTYFHNSFICKLDWNKTVHQNKQKTIQKRSLFPCRVPERCRSGAGAPPGQTGPWATRLGSSSPSWERQWGMSESPPVHQLHDKDRMHLFKQATQHRGLGYKVLLWKVEVGGCPLSLPPGEGNLGIMLNTNLSFQPQIHFARKVCLPLSTSKTSPAWRALFYTKPSGAPSSAAAWTPLMERCSGDTSRILDRLHLHSLPSSLAPNETSGLLQRPTNASTPWLPSTYLTSSHNTHAPSQNLWT